MTAGIFRITPPFPGTDAGLMTEAFAIRREVFVDEQRVPIEEEMDAYDDGALHWLARDAAGRPVATARMLEPEPGVGKIGRVAVLKPHRGNGLGKALMEEIVAEARRRRFRKLKLDAQTYAMAFYEKLGFAAYGDEFLDANIPHYHMAMTLTG